MERVDLGYGTDADALRAWDREYLWHPFTFLREWLAPDSHLPLVTGGEGAYLIDASGRRLIDGNASIWCNVHGHGHPRVVGAVKEQLDRFAHSSFLGLTHPPAIVLAKRLIGDHLGKWGFTRVFFSESGSNAIEAALRMALQWHLLEGRPRRRKFVAFRRSYHGDSLGASSVTGLTAFNADVGRNGYEVVWLDDDGQLGGIDDTGELAALIVEPMVAGAAGMKPWPDGMLRASREWCDHHGVLFLHDEVFTGFGRTGRMFAFEHEACPADILILGKALSGGIGPISATVVTDRVFRPFAEAGTVEENFLYGHSYAGHAPACAGGIASLDVFAEEGVLERVGGRIETLREELERLAALPGVREVRQRGFAAAVEVADVGDEGSATEYGRSVGRRVTRAAWELGLAVRAVGNSVVLVLPLCATDEVVRETAAILGEAIRLVVPVSLDGTTRGRGPGIATS